MNKLREIVIEKFSTQFVLSFADRPDCLFPRVHQKLNIVIAKRVRMNINYIAQDIIFGEKKKENNFLMVVK